ncbi:MAG TPA: hypothetical protein VF163_10945 [Micromonosporaceae bacterium]
MADKEEHVPDAEPSGTVMSGPSAGGSASTASTTAGIPVARAPGADVTRAEPAGSDGDGVPGPIVPGDQAASDAAAAAVARLAEPDLPVAEKRRALGELAAGLRKRGFRDMLRPKAAMAWVAETIVDIAPRIQLRSLDTLRGHFPGLTDQQIADRLVRNAARTSAGIGVVGGSVSAIQWAAPPALLSAPVLLAAETVAVVAVEIKLIGELQELYGQPVPGNTAERAVTLLQAWAGRRGVNLMVPGRGLAAVLGTAARHELRDRLVRRFGRNLTTLGPLFTGAAVAAYLNRRATKALADEVRRDLARWTAPRQLPHGG